MLEKSKKNRVIVAAVLLLAGFILPFFVKNTKVIALVFLLSWFIAGIDIIYQAILNLKNKMLLAEHFLMSIATIGAIAIGEYKEAAMVMVLFQIGELLEDRAVDKSRESIAELMDIAAPVAYKLVGEERIEIDPDEIEKGDVLEVRAGEKIPVDAVVIKGKSYIDSSALTGESIPVEVYEGQKVLSGSINGDGWLLIEAEKTASDSTAMKIIELLEEATENQAETESFISKFAKVYTPIVVGLAIIIAFVIPLFIQDAVFEDWFKRGLIFLVVSCPCAFVVSVPMAFVLGIGSSSRLGILVKGGNVFENINKVEILATDKTGTLTQGKFSVTGVDYLASSDEEMILKIAGELEKGSSHPIAKAIRDYARANVVNQEIDLGEIKNIQGRGVINNGDQVYVLGNISFMKDNNLFGQYESDDDKSRVYLGQVSPVKRDLAVFEVEDKIKDDAKDFIDQVHKRGVKEVFMLTGDEKSTGQRVFQKLGLDGFLANLLPQDKLNWVVDKKKSTSSKLLYIGDGLNDAPVIASSDVGVSMGGIGSDASIEASDVVIVNDDLSSIPKLFDLSKYTLKVAMQNIWLSLGIKLIFLALSAFGLTQMWMAVFADVGVTLLAIANSFRIYFYPRKLK
ncbi:MAG: heavy metal translocating P-type ATPase [Tissierellia bacterium]|nr:heavy metal translocating P-type ATPase [Tissierellia bacterium]